MSDLSEEVPVRSPVVRADCKFFGRPPELCVDVRFASVEELDGLIAALTQMRGAGPEWRNHVHLQDHDLRRPTDEAVGAEITFWPPGVPRGETEAECVRTAAESLPSRGE